MACFSLEAKASKAIFLAQVGASGTAPVCKAQKRGRCSAFGKESQDIPSPEQEAVLGMGAPNGKSGNNKSNKGEFGFRV